MGFTKLPNRKRESFMNQKKAIIIGAGPAGLTAAYELLTKTDIKPIIIEKSSYMGGISKTVNYKGNRIDIGGHRFFSKSDRVMQWWHKILPDMLTRQRTSRIYFNRTFFDYPISLTPQTLLSLGIKKTFLIGISYCKQMLFPIKHEKNLEDFLINRFGRQLYLTFFKSYTEKVWGIPCDKISAEWGTQRIKGLSIGKAIVHFFKSLLPKKKDLAQKETETTLIAQFLYPKHGPGEMWETVAEKIKQLGGTILTNQEVVTLEMQEKQITGVTTRDVNTGENKTHTGDYFISSMPIQDLINSLKTKIPSIVQEISEGLIYRDFITVGLLVKKLKIKAKNGQLIKDNWIYIQEPDVTVGRLQIFNNWSPSMVADPDTVWLGLEYFCFQDDELWKKTDHDMTALAKKELAEIDIIMQSDVLDATVIREEKTYPAYFGTYNQFDTLIRIIRCFQL